MKFNIFSVSYIIIAYLQASSALRIKQPLCRASYLSNVEGVATKPGEVSCLMAIYIKNIGDTETYLCTFSLINLQTAVGPAHCLNSNSIEQIYGVVNNVNRLEGDKVYFSAVKIHDGFNSQTLENDVALLLLENPIVPTKTLQPMGLPFEDSRFWLNTLLLVGWGGTVNGANETSTVLHTSKVYITDTVTCKLYFPCYQITGKQICGIKNNGDCEADSGSPIIFNATDKLILAGFFSWGAPICNDYLKVPSVYTATSSYISWIRENSIGDIVVYE